MKTLYFGGPILTMKDDQKEAEAVLIDDGKILAVGEKADLLEKHDNVEEVDLQGQTLMPAFIDPHSHVSMMAQTAFMADLEEAESFDDVIQILTDYKKENNLTDEDPITGFGYDHNFLEESAHPTKDVLDQVSTTNPIFILHTSAHMACVNSKTLKLAGIDSSKEDPAGGTIGRVDGSDEPSGYLEEGATGLVQEPVFGQIKMDMDKLIVEAQDLYLENRITTVQDGATTEQEMTLLKKANDDGLLKLDTIAYPLLMAEGQKLLKENSEYVKQYQKRLKIGGYKMLLDGSPQGKSAWMTEPYEGEESYRGYPWLKDADVKSYIETALEDNQQLLVHANGDAAADQLLNLYNEAYEESTNDNKANLRPTMIHCQTVREDQLDQMVELNMLPSIFISHTYHWGDVHLKNFGEERGNRISPAKSAFDRGLVVNFHQDSPVVKPLMLHTVWCAVNRQTREGVSIGADQRIGVYDALKAVTINAAHAYCEENIKGSLEAGKLADLVILDKNPLEVDPDDIKDIQVMETIKEGETIFKRN